jgi:hypothetical protein
VRRVNVLQRLICGVIFTGLLWHSSSSCWAQQLNCGNEPSLSEIRGNVRYYVQLFRQKALNIDNFTNVDIVTLVHSYLVKLTDTRDQHIAAKYIYYAGCIRIYEIRDGSEEQENEDLKIATNLGTNNDEPFATTGGTAQPSNAFFPAGRRSVYPRKILNVQAEQDDAG